MTTQTEQIIWHKYADEKPEKQDKYIVCVEHAPDIMGCTKEMVFATYYKYLNVIGKPLEHWSLHDGFKIITWAEKPKGWEEE